MVIKHSSRIPYKKQGKSLPLQLSYYNNFIAPNKRINMNLVEIGQAKILH